MVLNDTCRRTPSFFILVQNDSAVTMTINVTRGLREEQHLTTTE